MDNFTKFSKFFSRIRMYIFIDIVKIKRYIYYILFYKNSIIFIYLK